MNHRKYNSPFSNRYEDEAMSYVFSDEHKYTIWRYLWYVLANEERKLGAPITADQVKEIGNAIKIGIDYGKVKEYEDEIHHDVMAHLKFLGDQCPGAKPILHLGATSCYITDNTDVIIMNRALNLVLTKLNLLVDAIADFAEDYADVETVAYTHFQVAQPKKKKKRACLWLNDFLTDIDEVKHQKSKLKTIGCKGATGNMSGTIRLFNNDLKKARVLDENICKCIGIPPVAVSGQTYSRKQDYRVMQSISGIAQSASKMATDIRLLSGLGEIREGFGENQVGSSAMPYKKNPIECEKITSISRYVISNVQNTAITSATQWLERTLDDSANRRIVIADTFMAISEVLNCCINVVDNLDVNSDLARSKVEENKDKFMSEFSMIEQVKKGGDRQEIHEQLRQDFMSGAYPKIYVDNSILSGSASFDVKTFLEKYEQQRQKT